MRELLWQIGELNKEIPTWNVIGYVDKCGFQGDESLDVSVGSMYCPYLGEDEYLLGRQKETNVAVSVGEPGLRKKIAEELSKNPRLKFPSLIMGDTRLCTDIKMGQGCIISMGCQVSTNVMLGDFVLLNIGSLVCHDGILGDYVTLSPDVKAAGQVVIGNCCDLGLGTRIIQGITIGDGVIAGAGSVIVKDVEAGCTIAGVPAKRIK